MQFGIYYTKASYNFEKAINYFLFAAQGNNKYLNKNKFRVSNLNRT